MDVFLFVFPYFPYSVSYLHRTEMWTLRHYSTLTIFMYSKIVIRPSKSYLMTN
jgi:hypothetical protein